MPRKREAPHNLGLLYRIAGLLRAGCIQEAITLAEHEKVRLPKDEVEGCIVRMHAHAKLREHISDDVSELLLAAKAAGYTTRDGRLAEIVAFEVMRHADQHAYVLTVLLASEGLLIKDDIFRLTQTEVLGRGYPEEAATIAKHYGFSFSSEDMRACGDGLLVRRAAAIYADPSDESAEDPAQLERDAISAYEHASG